MTLNVDKIMIWISGKSRRRPLRSIRLLCTKQGDTPLTEVNRTQMPCPRLQQISTRPAWQTSSSVDKSAFTEKDLVDLVTTATWATVRPIAIALQLPAWALLRKQAGQCLEWTRGPYMAKGVSKAAVEVLEPAQRRPRLHPGHSSRRHRLARARPLRPGPSPPLRFINPSAGTPV